MERFDWFDFDPASRRVYAEGDLLPATDARVVGVGLAVRFALETGLTADLSVWPENEPEDRVLMSLAFYETDRTGAERYYGVVVNNGQDPVMGFDSRVIPPDEAWVVDEFHRYGVINEVVEAPECVADIKRLLAAWSGLRMVDKREDVPATSF